VGPIKAGCLTILVGAVAVIATVYVLHQQSFCISEMRFTTDEEKISAAAMEAFQWNNGLAKSTLEKRPIAYTSLEEFRRLNEQCCSVVSEEMRHGPDRFEIDTLDFFEILTGSRVDQVMVRYREVFRDKRGSEKVEEKLRIVPVSACARVSID
jgi:hypothetical protein